MFEENTYCAETEPINMESSRVNMTRKFIERGRNRREEEDQTVLCSLPFCAIVRVPLDR